MSAPKNPQPCSVDSCPKPAKTWGMCGMHAERVRHHGTTDLLVRPTATERFWVKVDKSSECWIWQSTLNNQGYGMFYLNGRRWLAHRVSYVFAKGDIPAGLVIDHLCRTHACVNPSHLEAVSQRENMRRGTSPAAKQAAQTHCKEGHEFTPENTQIDAKGKRRCRTCYRAWARAARIKKGAAA